MMDIDFVTLGADVGGKDAFTATNQHVLALRSLLHQECSGSFGSPLKEISLILRVDGSVQSWGKRGVENVTFYKKKSSVTADIFVPVDVWATGDAVSLQLFLVDQVIHAIQLVVEFVNCQGLVLNEKELECALKSVRQKYLG